MTLLPSLLLQLRAFVLPIDAAELKVAADSFQVPYAIAISIAWSETGSGTRWDALGPGIEAYVQPDKAKYIFEKHRICREVSRFQLSPCIDWVARLGDPLCTYTNLRHNRQIGIHCGMANLKHLLTIYHDPVMVIKRQNGGGPMADAYVLRTLSYLGWLTLKHPELIQ